MSSERIRPSDQEQPRSGGASTAETRPTPQVGRRGPQSGHQLESESGTTTIADLVVGKIAGIAASEVDGVYELRARGAGETIAGLTGRVGGGTRYHHGVDVEVGKREAALDLSMTVMYGVSIPDVAEAVRRNIMDRVQTMTGLIVKEVNIDVEDVYVPGDEFSEPRVE